MVFKFLSGHYGYASTRISSGLDAGATVDASGAAWTVANSRNSDPVEGYGADTGDLPINRYPLQVFNAAAGVIIKGGLIYGEVPQHSEWTWTYQGANSAAVRVGDSPSATIQDWRITQPWDGIRVTGASNGFTISGAWISDARDDAVENDYALSGAIRDSLFDGVFSGISLGGAAGAVDGSGNTVTFEGLLLRSESYLYKGQITHTSPIKTNSSAFETTPQLRFINTVIAIEDPNHVGQHRLQNAWDNTIESSGNTFLNLSDTPLSDAYPKPGAGWTILEGQAARDYWDQARSTWIANHPAPPLLDLDDSADGTGYAAAFTEDQGAVAVAGDGAFIGDADDTNMEGLTVALTNARAGDQLLVDAAGLPAGINVSPLSTAASVILIGSAGIADYTAALRQVLFNNTSDTPDPTPRVINVTVNDGAASSSPAVATIAVPTAPVMSLSGHYGYSSYRISSGLDAGTTIDASGASWTVANSRNSNPVEGHGADTGDLPINRYPFQVLNAEEVIVKGGLIHGEVPQDSDWTWTYKDAYPGGVSANSAAVRVWDSPGATIQDWRITQPWDGIRVSGSSDEFTISGAWISDARDDAVENDYQLSGAIRDSLFDGVFSGISLGGAAGADGSGNTVTFEGMLLRSKSYLYKGEMTHTTPIKPYSAALETTPQLRFINTVIAIEDPNHVGQHLLQNAWDKTIESSGNTFLNLSDTPLSDSYPKPGDGWTILEGQAARDYWNQARSTWIANHPAAPLLDLDDSAGGTGYVATFTEDQDAVAVAGAGAFIGDADDTQVEGLTVALADARAGDQLLVNVASLPAGISVSPLSTATTVILIGSAGTADYETALRQVLFNNTSDTPDPTPRVINVTVTDGTASSRAAGATIAITPQNDAPTAANGATVTAEDMAISAGPLPVATDLDGDAVNYAAGAIGPANGIVTVYADGAFDYTPHANFNGTDTFSFVVSDGNGGSNEHTYAVTVSPINDAPTAANGMTTTNEDVAIIAEPLPAATDLDGDAGNYAAGAIGPASGTVAVYADGTFDYTPAANFNGTDIFSFVVSDGNGGSNEYTTAVTVSPVNDAPTSADGTATIGEDTAIIAGLLPAPADIEGDAVSFALGATAPASGTVAVYADGTFDYTPAANFSGTDTFSFVVSDGNGGSNEYTYAVTVTPANNAATGEPAVSDTSPSEAQTLLASPGSIADIGGTMTAVFAYQWQLFDGTDWMDIAGAASPSFTPTQVEVARQLRVVASFTDDQGTPETVLSAPTIVVGDRFTSNSGRQTFNGTAGDDIASTGADKDVLKGHAGDDILNGGTGVDRLDGGAGADAMTGGTGNDTYLVDDAGDTVIERAGEGTDTVETLLSTTTLGTNVEKLIFIGTGAFAGTGNAAKNTITGGSGSDTLDGGSAADILSGTAGDDILQGGDGGDSLDGGTGADAMTGGTGNDIYSVDDAGDSVVEFAGQGTDTVKTSLATYTLGADVEKLVFTGAGPFVGTGNELANTVTGGSGNDTLDGGAGNDRLYGKGGRDTFVFMEGSGHDRIFGFAATGTSSDLIEIRGTAFTSFTDLQAAGVVAQVGGHVVVTLGIDTLTINSVTLANVADDFLFV